MAFKWESLNPPLEKQSMDVRAVVGTYIHNSRVVKMKKCQELMVVLSASFLHPGDRKDIEKKKKIYKNSLL